MDLQDYLRDYLLSVTDEPDTLYVTVRTSWTSHACLPDVLPVRDVALFFMPESDFEPDDH